MTAELPDSPLTCERCKHAPATHLVVAHWRAGKAKRLLCAADADLDAVEAGHFRVQATVYALEIQPGEMAAVKAGEDQHHA